MCVQKKICTLDKKVKKKKFNNPIDDTKCLIYTHIDNFLKNNDEIELFLAELIKFRLFNFFKINFRFKN